MSRKTLDPKEKVTKKNYLHTKKNDLLKSQYISFTVIHKIPMKPKTNTTTTITKKQKILLTIVFTFRFINSKQIQQLLNHKDHRRINSWLKDLTEKGYIQRDFQPMFGTLTKPAVYFLSTKGRDFIRNTYLVDNRYLDRLREDRKRSKTFRTRCQIVVDCFLLLFPDQVTGYIHAIDKRINQETVMNESNLIQFVTPAFYEDMDCMLLSPLKPDAYGYTTINEKTMHIFILILDAFIPKMMRQTLK
jgi:hypothetical protein